MDRCKRRSQTRKADRRRRCGPLAYCGTDNPDQGEGSPTMRSGSVSHNHGMARTVLIVDDHPSFRTSARRVLEDAGYDAVGEAPDGASALAAAGELHPAIVLLDILLPDVDGFEIAMRLTSGDNPPAVVLTSSHDRGDFADMIGRSGARGFLPKAELSGPALAALVSAWTGGER